MDKMLCFLVLSKDPVEEGPGFEIMVLEPWNRAPGAPLFRQDCALDHPISADLCRRSPPNCFSSLSF